MPLALLGIDVGDVVGDAIRALVDLLVPDFGAGWVSRLVTWLVALPPVTGDAFPSLRGYARDLTAVGYGLLGASLVGGLLQLWAAGFAGGPTRAGEALRRGAIAAIALAAYPSLLGTLLVGVNLLTAAMVRHPLVVDGLDKAFGEAFAVAAVTGGLSLGLAVGAAVALLYFVAALVVFKVALTAVLAIVALSGALVWGLYPLPQASWLPRAWLSGLATALVLPIAWACVFAGAALLARDALVFDGGSRFNEPLGDALAYIVKPLATVACFWLAYKAPTFLLTLARSAGVPSAALAGLPLGASGPARASARAAGSRRAPDRAVVQARDRFRTLTRRAGGSTARGDRRTPSPSRARPRARDAQRAAQGMAQGSAGRASARAAAPTIAGTGAARAKPAEPRRDSNAKQRSPRNPAKAGGADRAARGEAPRRKPQPAAPRPDPAAPPRGNPSAAITGTSPTRKGGARAPVAVPARPDNGSRRPPGARTAYVADRGSATRPAPATGLRPKQPEPKPVPIDSTPLRRPRP